MSTFYIYNQKEQTATLILNKSFIADIHINYIKEKYKCFKKKHFDTYSRYQIMEDSLYNCITEKIILKELGFNTTLELSKEHLSFFQTQKTENPLYELSILNDDNHSVEQVIFIIRNETNETYIGASSKTYFAHYNHSCVIFRGELAQTQELQKKILQQYRLGTEINTESSIGRGMDRLEGEMNRQYQKKPKEGKYDLVLYNGYTPLYGYSMICEILKVKIPNITKNLGIEHTETNVQAYTNKIKVMIVLGKISIFGGSYKECYERYVKFGNIFNLTITPLHNDYIENQIFVGFT
jgi:hypothetical protein